MVKVISRRVAAALLAIALFAPQCWPQPLVSGGPQPPLEYAVRAAFLLNFTKFIDWPQASASEPFRICIAGDDPFLGLLDQTVRGEAVNGRPIVVDRAGSASLNGCQMIYVPGRPEKDIKELAMGKRAGTLTVGEGESFLRSGGMIAFELDNRRVRFRVNLGAARGAMLNVSSRLLAVAKSVDR